MSKKNQQLKPIINQEQMDQLVIPTTPDQIPESINR